MIHTVPINQPGGVKLGFCNVVYHVWTEGESEDWADYSCWLAD